MDSKLIWTVNNMLIHFAFGADAKKGDLDLQFEKFKDYILKEKQLKYSVCHEFIPTCVDQNKIQIDLSKAQVHSQGGISISLPHAIRKDKATINYSPEDVSMICFIDLAFKKLAAHNHSKEYGKLGIVFNKEFYNKNNVKHVSYYTEDTISKDKLINLYQAEPINSQQNKGILDTQRKEYLDLLNSKGFKDKTHLSKEITAYRKPQVLTDNFGKSISLRMTVVSPGVVEKNISTYDRYDIGYDFTNERECRAVSFDEQTFLKFDENDIYMVIVPTDSIKDNLLSYFKEYWSTIPKVEVFPSKTN